MDGSEIPIDDQASLKVLLILSKQFVREELAGNEQTITAVLSNYMQEEHRE